MGSNLTLRTIFAICIASLAIGIQSSAFSQTSPAIEGQFFGGGLGRYQITQTMLGDIGWISSDGIWSKRAQKWKVGSKEDFLDSPRAQEAAIEEYFRRLEGRLKKNGSMSHVGQEYVAPRLGRFMVTESGVVAAAHLLGTLRTKEILDKLRMRRNDKSILLLPEEDRAVKRMRDFAEVSYEKLQ
jgi:hypothetical protein